MPINGVTGISFPFVSGAHVTAPPNRAAADSSSDAPCRAVPTRRGLLPLSGCLQKRPGARDAVPSLAVLSSPVAFRPGERRRPEGSRIPGPPAESRAFSRSDERANSRVRPGQAQRWQDAGPARHDGRLQPAGWRRHSWQLSGEMMPASIAHIWGIRNPKCVLS